MKRPILHALACLFLLAPAGSFALEVAGLVYYNVEPCPLVRTKAVDAKFEAGEARDFLATDEERDLSLQGGDELGCGIPASAEALSVNVRVKGTESNGWLRVWASALGENDSGILSYTAGEITNNATILEITPPPLRRQASGDFSIRTSAAAHVSVIVTGYFAGGPTGPQGEPGPPGLDGEPGQDGQAGPAGPVAGADTQIVFNDGGHAAGDAELVYNKTTNQLGVGTPVPAAAAALDIKSTTGGVLFPRLNTTQRDALSSNRGQGGVTPGTVIFNTDNGKLEVFSHSQGFNSTDQVNTEHSEWVPTAGPSCGQGGFCAMGQTFTVGSSGVLTHIYLTDLTVVGCTDIQMTVYRGSDVIVSWTRANHCNGGIHPQFPAPPFVTAGETLKFRIDSTQADFSIPGSVNDPYPGGDAILWDAEPSESVQIGHDLVFNAQVAPITPGWVPLN